jgi:hypothetical protein
LEEAPNEGSGAKLKLIDDVEILAIQSMTAEVTEQVIFAEDSSNLTNAIGSKCKNYSDI